MTYRSLIQSALEPSHLATTLTGRDTLGVYGTTLPKPLSSYESWRGLVLVGHHDEWNPRLAMERMEVTQIKYEPEKDVHGYAIGHDVAIAPDSFSPLRTLMHELSHIALGHTYVESRRGREKALREVQAEVSGFCVQAMIGALTRETMAVSQRYIQYHYGNLSAPLTDGDLLEVNLAVETVLKAGQ